MVVYLIFLSIQGIAICIYCIKLYVTLLSVRILFTILANNLHNACVPIVPGLKLDCMVGSILLVW